MDLRGISDAHRRLRKSHEALRFSSHAQRSQASAGRESDVEEYRSFRIHYHHRTQGVTMSRTLFSAVIEGDAPRTKIYLSGFPNRTDAQKASHNRIDAILHQAQRHKRARRPSLHSADTRQNPNPS